MHIGITLKPADLMYLANLAVISDSRTLVVYTEIPPPSKGVAVTIGAVKRDEKGNPDVGFD